MMVGFGVARRTPSQ